MTKGIKRIAVTGAGGQIAYSILFRIANGDLFGKDQPIALHLLEVPESLSSLKGVVMELEDCAFPLLREIHIGTDPEQVFQGTQYIFLIGAKPRGPGMERKDLLMENAKIFVEQGKALDKSADKQAIVLVVGNPCNTNCLISQHFVKRLNPRRFFAMTRLDQNRATSLLAQKAKAEVSEISNVCIWGNHSSTQVPDFLNAKIREEPILEIIQDKKWLEMEFIPKVQKRGAEVIAARGKSSAASAASSAIDAMRSLVIKSEQIFSMALIAHGNPYGIKEDLVFSFPCRLRAEGDVEIVKGFHWDSFLKEKILLSEKELIEEQTMIESLLR